MSTRPPFPHLITFICLPTPIAISYGIPTPHTIITNPRTDYIDPQTPFLLQIETQNQRKTLLPTPTAPSAVHRIPSLMSLSPHPTPSLLRYTSHPLPPGNFNQNQTTMPKMPTPPYQQNPDVNSTLPAKPYQNRTTKMPAPPTTPAKASQNHLTTRISTLATPPAKPPGQDQTTKMLNPPTIPAKSSQNQQTTRISTPATLPAKPPSQNQTIRKEKMD